MNKIPIKVLIAGTVRNVSTSVIESINTIESAFVMADEIKWLIIESDSTDDTLETLEGISLKKSNFEYVSLGNLSVEHPQRTDRIAVARNEYLKNFQHSKLYSNCTHLVVADLDGVNNLLTKEGINSSLTLGGKCVYTANQLGPYYDIWALRHNLWSPNDCWAELAFYKKRYKWPEYALKRAILSRMIQIREDEDLLEVDSAFGGLAIYPREAVEGLMYVGLDASGNEICEHVQFSMNIGKKGFKIFINPKMINTSYTEISSQKKFRKKMLRIAKYPIKKIRNLPKK